MLLWHFFVLYCAVLHYIAALYAVNWSQCNHGNVILTSMFICVLANQLCLSHILPPQTPLCFFLFFFLLQSSVKDAMCLKGAGPSAISHHLTDSSI